MFSWPTATVCEAYVASLWRSADLVSNITLEDWHSTRQMGGGPGSLCSGELRVWLKQLALTPQPTHLLHPVALLKFHSFFILSLFGWLGATVNKTDPRNDIWSRGNVCLTFCESNEKFKFNHRHVISSIANFWGSFFFLYLFAFWGVGIWWLMLASGDFITSQPSFSKGKTDRFLSEEKSCSFNNSPVWHQCHLLSNYALTSCPKQLITCINM